MRFAQLLAQMHHGRLNAYVTYAVVCILLTMVLTYLW